MRIPKRYGEGKVEHCPFCGKQALIMNPQDIPVCKDHKETNMPELKCMCGEYLFMQKGKFGTFFNCIKCGNINLNKALSINDISKLMKQEPKKTLENVNVSGNQSSKSQPKNIVIRSDDPDYFD